MSLTIDNSIDAPGARSAFRVSSGVGLAALILLCAVVLFVDLGRPALFDPDEGRNAEKAREILLLNDWVTPHENFLAVLDKPIFYYWLVAASYKSFGISEWSARLPSALAGAGCVILVFLFARRFFGYWEALWSGLILVTNIEFFLLSRIVIFDMTLTLFITLSLFSFFWALHEENSRSRRLFLILMYASLSVATLVKGPIGVALPTIVALVYMITSRKLFLLRRLELPFGILFFFAIVAPWYYQVELRNPGYLRYFLWEENFLRYLTPHFNRGQGWYYFFTVLAIGFIPWTLCIPEVIKQAWRQRGEDNVLFLSLWAALPFIFFSFSSAKLPHYILPIYPPLALLTGITVERKLKTAGSRHVWLLLLSCLCLFALSTCFIAGSWAPRLFPDAARFVLAGISPLLRATALITTLGFAIFAIFIWRGRWKTHAAPFLGFCIGLILYISLFAHVLTISSIRRSTREFIEKVSPLIDSTAQIVIYNTSFESLPFYLKISQPIWIVWSGEKPSVMGSFYLAEQGARSAPGFGNALLTFEEFKDQWAKTPNKHFAVVMKVKNLLQLEDAIPNAAKHVFEYHDLAFVTN
jgi:4-amino-4-deoxy-L-arabinose transferase-like glycosyltransferase